MSEPLVTPTLYLAPIRGVTDAVFRTVYARHFQGIDLAIAPFLTTHSSARIPARHVRDLAPAANPAMPVIPQILSKSAVEFITLARHLFEELGYTQVNWNLGCPFPQVANKGRGSGLLPHPERIDAFLEEALAAIPNRLSIKTRLGRRDPGEMAAVARVFNRYPLEEVIVHPRTGIQMYDGRPDLEAFAVFMGLCTHRVVYNGDILSEAVFAGLRARFPAVGAWMVGRPALANPFLPGLLKGVAPLPPDPVAAYRRFHDDLLHHYRERLSGPGHLLDRMKGLWRYFHVPFAHGAEALKCIHKAAHLDLYEELAARFFDGEDRWTGEVRFGA
jgi:tRNA-dihydrouridine synthase B